MLRKSWGAQPKTKGQPVKPQIKSLWFLFGESQITPQVPAAPHNLGRCLCLR